MNDTLYVLAKNRHTYFIERLTEEIGQRVKVLSPWEDTLGEMCPHKILVRTSAVHGSDADLHFLQKHFLPDNIINPLGALERLRTKKSLYECLPQLGLPILHWLDLQKVKGEELRAFTEGGEHFLIKPHRGQGGWGIQTFSAHELQQWLRSSTDREYLLQPFCPGRECRTFFTGDWVITLERVGKAVAANFAQGGEARVVEAPNEVLEQVQKIRDVFGLKYGAVDFLLVHGQWMVLDVNLAPGIEQLEKISGYNVIKRVLAHL